MNLEDPTELALAVASTLAEEGVAAAVYGGLALAVWGEPRETKDADFALAGLDVRRTVSALSQRKLSPSVSFERVTFGGNHITRVALLGSDEHIGLNVVDFVEPRSARFAAAILERAVSGPMRGEMVTIVSPEDFVLLKILSTRAVDVEDAANVIRALGDRLDSALVEREASLLAGEITDHDVEGRLKHARRSAAQI